MISVAAELAEMHPQTLRMYEARGLIEPKRSPKGTRLYSQQDVERLRRIQEMTTELGMNLAGVERVFELEDQLERMRDKVAALERRAGRLQEEIAALEARQAPGQGGDRALRGARRHRAHPGGAPPAGRRPERGVDRRPGMGGNPIQGRRPGHVPVDAAGPQVGGDVARTGSLKPRTRAPSRTVRSRNPA